MVNMKVPQGSADGVSLTVQVDNVFIINQSSGKAVLV
jgi:hypothetical protein